MEQTPGGNDVVRTPERVAIEIDLAGVGSRGIAQLIDLSATTLALILVTVVLLLMRSVLGSMAYVLILVFAFLIYWFYFALFEGLWAGQTPGKRVMALRVQKVGGYPIGWTEALLRNLLRPVDGLFAYAVGMVVMLSNARSQRIGDIVAGTVVVRESVDGAVELTALGFEEEIGPSSADTRLTLKEYEVLHDFLNRRGQIEPEAARMIETRLAGTLRAKLRQRGGMVYASVSDEAFLVNLDAEYRGESSGFALGRSVDRDAKVPGAEEDA